MGSFPLEFFKPFPRLIEGLALHLEEGSNVIAKLSHFPSGKYLQRNAFDIAS